MFSPEYNLSMESPFETMIKLADAVEYFNLQKTPDGWYLSFVTNEPQDFMNQDLEKVLREASSVVFASLQDPPEAPASSVLPSPRNL